MLSEMQFPLVSSLLKTWSGNFSHSCVFRNGYATFEKIETRTITVKGNRGESKKAKLFITLRKSKDFAANMDKFNKIREENEKLKTEREEAKK